MYHKVDSIPCKSYRDISLLNTMCKILEAARQRRIEEEIEAHFQKTQYGFRKKKGFSEAPYNICPVIIAGESSQNTTVLLLLDWAMAFDNICHEGLISAPARTGVAERDIRRMSKKYANLTFYAEVDGQPSRT